jgi:TPR repeat protein
LNDDFTENKHNKTCVYLGGLSTGSIAIRQVGLLHPDGQCRLGLCFLDGTGLRQSDRKATMWLRKAALQGHDKA